jgi:hypothetical protein
LPVKRPTTPRATGPTNWQIADLDQPVYQLVESPLLYLATDKPFKLSAAHVGRLREYLNAGGMLVCVPEGNFVIEQTPVLGDGAPRGVVAEGAVGSRWAAHFRIFRYELRRWQEALEQRVRERTIDLAAANEALRLEVRERKDAEDRVQAFATSSAAVAAADRSLY